MAPSQSQSNAKRKTVDDGNPLLAAKKQKKESKAGSSNKRKLLNAEETPGGLLIVRAADTRVSASQPGPSNTYENHAPRPISSQPSTSSKPTSDVAPSRPPTKKFRAGSQPLMPTSGPVRIASRNLTSLQEEAEVEKDIRAMEDEADNLRRKSRAHTVDPSLLPSHTAFQAPPHTDLPNKKGKMRTFDTSQPVAENETPQIMRNKRMREGAMAAIGNGQPQEEGNSGSEKGRGHRRKSSLSRGKRISSSYENTGVITQPHNSVADHSFYKHIDPDLPDSERVRQLLIWCSFRAGSIPSNSRSAPSKSTHATSLTSQPPLPPLSAEATKVLKATQESIIKKLAEKQVDLSLFGPEAGGSGSHAQETEENEQNVRNRRWEVIYTDQIKRAQAEEEEWKKVSYRYDIYVKKLQAASEKRLAIAKSLEEQQTPSAKAKGKQREINVELAEEFMPREHELPPDLQSGLRLARSILGIDDSSSRASSHNHLSYAEEEAKLEARMQDLQFNLDQLLTFANTARAATNTIEKVLDERFQTLSQHLTSRHLWNPPPTDSESGTSILSTYVRREPVTEPNPRDLLRALSRVDSERPLGDAARRAAREVQRIGESGVAPVGERRLTGVPTPSTPRKAPGTPRRGGTPGREKEKDR